MCVRVCVYVGRGGGKNRTLLHQQPLSSLLSLFPLEKREVGGKGVTAEKSGKKKKKNNISSNNNVTG
jgi:hypothetical protein